MITSIEIAKLLRAQEIKGDASKRSFDAALLGLGIAGHKMGKKKSVKRTKNG